MNNLSLKAKLLGTISVAVGLLVIILIPTAVFIFSNVKDFLAMQELHGLTLESQYLTAQIGDAVKGYVANPSNLKALNSRKIYEEEKIKILQEINTKLIDAEIASLMKELEVKEDIIDPIENELIKEGRLGNTDNIYQIMDEKYQPAKEAYDELAFKINEKIDNLIEQTKQKTIRVIFIALIVVSILGIVMFTIVAYLTTRVSNQMKQIGENIKTSVEQLLKSAHTTTETSEAVSHSSSASAASLEETVASLEELSSIVNTNASNAKEAAELSQKGSQSAENGGHRIDSLIKSMVEMADGAKKIEEIISVIDDISFQTNLLALNAAVEAARAGEQGKGFAVVADAVRGLAQKSASSAKDIAGLIKNSVERTQEGRSAADSSGVALTEILTAVKKVASINSAISVASDEQAKGISQISQAMNQLDQSTQQNASSAASLATEAQTLTKQANELEGNVNNLMAIIEGQ